MDAVFTMYIAGKTIMDPIRAISNAVDLVKKAQQVSNDLANLELRQALCDALEQCVQVKADFVELKDAMNQLAERNAALIAENKKLSAPPELVFKGGATTGKPRTVWIWKTRIVRSVGIRTAKQSV